MSGVLFYADKIVDLAMAELLILGFILRLAIGFEARNWLRLGLEWRGYRLDAVVMADDIEAAEARYFATPERPQKESASAGGIALDALATRLGRRP